MRDYDMAEAELLSTFIASRDAWNQIATESELFAFENKTIKKGNKTFNHIVLACKEITISLTLKSVNGYPVALKKA